MILLCHNESCKGNGEPAGRDPEGACGFCGNSLQDTHGVLLVAPPSLMGGDLQTNLAVLPICGYAGHAWEGRYVPELDRLSGRCGRCGITILTDGE